MDKDRTLQRGDIVYCFDPLAQHKVQFVSPKIANCRGLQLSRILKPDANGNLFTRTYYKQDAKHFHKYYLGTPEVAEKWQTVKTANFTRKTFKKLILTLSLEEMKKVISFIRTLRKEHED